MISLIKIGDISKSFTCISNSFTEIYIIKLVRCISILTELEISLNAFEISQNNGDISLNELDIYLNALDS